MSYLSIEGGRQLTGTITAEGAKNAALPACASSLLTDEPVILKHVPHLRDVSTILAIVSSLGKHAIHVGDTVVITSGQTMNAEADAYYVEQMRASFLVLGPLLARLGHAIVPLPGGCTIGPRPIDMHLEGIRQLGATIETYPDRVCVTAERLTGARISLPYPSVGATEQLLMAASLARGETEIRNPAREPEITDLIDLLRKMGAQIEVETDRLRVAGVAHLHGANHTIIPDRMEIGTYLLAAAITGGSVKVEEVVLEHLNPLFTALQDAGISVSGRGKSVVVHSEGRSRPLQIKTSPHPGFPTDLHPPLAAMLSLAEGKSRLSEGVFKQRFTYAPGLNAMGAKIHIDGATARINGVRRLHGARVEAPDIRAGAALVLAGLAAEGVTTVHHLQPIDRGYTEMECKLHSLGATIERHP